MEISKLVETKGYKNSTVKICEFTLISSKELNSLLKSGHIIYCPDESKYEIKHITCAEKISDGAILIHEFNSIEKRK